MSLSSDSAISMASSNAQRQAAAVGQLTMFREIGQGSIDVVFEHSGTTWAFKLPLLIATKSCGIITSCIFECKQVSTKCLIYPAALRYHVLRGLPTSPRNSGVSTCTCFPTKRLFAANHAIYCVWREFCRSRNWYETFNKALLSRRQCHHRTGWSPKQRPSCAGLPWAKAIWLIIATARVFLP